MLKGNLKKQIQTVVLVCFNLVMSNFCRGCLLTPDYKDK